MARLAPRPRHSFRLALARPRQTPPVENRPLTYIGWEYALLNPPKPIPEEDS